MNDQKKNLFRAAFSLFLTLGCLTAGLKGFAGDSLYPYVGAGFCAFLTIAYLRRAIQR